MTFKIKWEKLLNETREKYKDKKPTLKEVDQAVVEKDPDINFIMEHRNQFERDYDRVMSSSSLRRLQDKAQVFPLQESDFIRTRLTHSMEVSAIARSFGKWLDMWLSKEGFLKEKDFGKIPAILATAGLVHDIGNPPFGHYGEDVIKKWFKSFFDESHKEEKLKLTEEEKNDFLSFDGNAQGIRVLSRLQFLNDQYGINFTYGTLSVLIKYPWDSSYSIAENKNKFGYFYQDQQFAKGILESTVGIDKCRNPLTYFLEASDDIAYLGADVEDGVKKGIIPWERVFEKEICGNAEIYDAYKEYIDDLKQKHDKAKENNFPDYLLTSVQNFKVWAQGQMIREVKQVFIENYKVIMNGEFGTEELLKKTNNARLLQALFKDLLSTYCFPDKEVLSLELIGDSVLSDLLNIFVKECVMDESYLDEKKNEYSLASSRPKSGKLFKMISSNFVFVHCLPEEKGKINKKKYKNIQDLNHYSRLLLVTDFISGMTDSYAVDLHQKLKGVKMP
ncbi:dGTP triphosphohydrolase [Bacillus altitudinis]|uniref:dGTP triphosphohydrolase n=1 Tax=Bacillus altitudinis TaxID=293387 RepID=UPI001980149A|nr:dNTP triphosphohydrolase [Bacillus altitudinis]QSI45632.1 dNTP triphosphohydrolase [Bacillus altitudinis]